MSEPILSRQLTQDAGDCIVVTYITVVQHVFPKLVKFSDIMATVHYEPDWHGVYVCYAGVEHDYDVSAGDDVEKSKHAAAMDVAAILTNSGVSVDFSS